MGYGFNLGLEKERLRCGGLDLGLERGAKIGGDLEQIKGKEPLNQPFHFSFFSSTNTEQSNGHFLWISDPILINNEQRKD